MESMRCSSCLTFNRKLKKLGSYSRVFEILVSDIQEVFGDITLCELLLCWECHAIIRKVTKFIEKVWNAQQYFFNLRQGGEPLPIRHIFLLSKTINCLKFIFTCLGRQCIVLLQRQIMRLMQRIQQAISQLRSKNKNPDTPTELTSIKKSEIFTIDSGTEEYIARNHSLFIFRNDIKVEKDDIDSLVIDDIDSNDNNVKDESTNSTILVELLPRIDALQDNKDVLSDEDDHLKTEQDVKVLSDLEIDWQAASDVEVLSNLASNSGVKKMRWKKKSSKEKKKVKKKKTALANKIRKPKSVRKSKTDMTDSSDKFVFGRMTEEEMWKARQEYCKLDTFVNWHFKCQLCLIVMHNREKLAEHMKKHEPKAGHKMCTICNMYLPSADKLRLHCATHYYKYECLHCEMVVPFKLGLMWRHYWQCHAPDVTHKCDQCGESFKSVHTLKLHCRTEHQAKVRCEQCNLAFTTMKNYERHMKNHVDKPLYACDQCDKVYTIRGSLNSHKRIHDTLTPGDAYCAECGFDFKSIASYRAHIKSSLKHATGNEQKFICDYCKKEFLKRHLLLTHISRMHLNCHFPCVHCGKVYKKDSSLVRHIAEVHEGREQPRDKICDICGKGFKTEKVLESHKRTHTGERPFECPHCEMNFSYQSALYMHKRLVHKVKTKKQKIQDSMGFCN